MALAHIWSARRLARPIWDHRCYIPPSAQSKDGSEHGPFVPPPSASWPAPPACRHARAYVYGAFLACAAGLPASSACPAPCAQDSTWLPSQHWPCVPASPRTSGAASHDGQRPALLAALACAWALPLHANDDVISCLSWRKWLRQPMYAMRCNGVSIQGFHDFQDPDRPPW